MTAAAPHQTNYIYDGFDRLKQTVYADATSDQVTQYDNDNNALTRVNRAGSTLTYTYDALDRMWTKAVPAIGSIAANTVTWTYDLANKVTQIGDTLGNTLVNGYDPAGRQTSATNTAPGMAAKTINYQVDNAGNRTPNNGEHLKSAKNLFPGDPITGSTSQSPDSGRDWIKAGGNVRRYSAKAYEEQGGYSGGAEGSKMFGEERLTSVKLRLLEWWWEPSAKYPSAEYRGFWRRAAGVGRQRLGVCDQLAKILDPEVCEGGRLLIARTVDPEVAVFGFHAQAEVPQPLLIDAEHLGDAGDGVDVADCGHDQAARLMLGCGAQFQGNNAARSLIL